MQDLHTDSSQAPPLLDLDDARIECTTGVLFDGLRCRAFGGRIALLGPWDALFRLLGGDARLTAGHAAIDGVAVPAGVAAGKVGVARQDVPFPAKWRGLDYLVQSARLSGWSGSPERRGRAVIEQLGLSRIAERPLKVMTPAERRAILIAHAVVSEPTTLALEAPLDDLDQASASRLASLIERAATGRKLIVSVRDELPGSARELLETTDVIVALRPRGEVELLRAVDLSAAVGRRYVIAVPRQAGPFATELERRGVHIERLGAGPDAASPVAFPPELGDQPGQFVVRLAEGLGTDVLLDASLALNLPIVHLAPAEFAVPGEPKREKC